MFQECIYTLYPLSILHFYQYKCILFEVDLVQNQFNTIHTLHVNYCMLIIYIHMYYSLSSILYLDLCSHIHLYWCSQQNLQCISRICVIYHLNMLKQYTNIYYFRYSTLIIPFHKYTMFEGNQDESL